MVKKIIQALKRNKASVKQYLFDVKLRMEELKINAVHVISLKNVLKLIVNTVIYFWALIGIFLAFGLFGGRKLWSNLIKQQGVKRRI